MMLEYNLKRIITASAAALLAAVLAVWAAPAIAGAVAGSLPAASGDVADAGCWYVRYAVEDRLGMKLADLLLFAFICAWALARLVWRKGWRLLAHPSFIVFFPLGLRLIGQIVMEFDMFVPLAAECMGIWNRLGSCIEDAVRGPVGDAAREWLLGLDGAGSFIALPAVRAAAGWIGAAASWASGIASWIWVWLEKFSFCYFRGDPEASSEFLGAIVVMYFFAYWISAAISVTVLEISKKMFPLDDHAGGRMLLALADRDRAVPRDLMISSSNGDGDFECFSYGTSRICIDASGPGALMHEIGHVAYRDTMALQAVNLFWFLIPVWGLAAALWKIEWVVVILAVVGSAGIFVLLAAFSAFGLIGSLSRMVDNILGGKLSEIRADLYAASRGYGDDLIEELSGEDGGNPFLLFFIDPHPPASLRIAIIRGYMKLFGWRIRLRQRFVVWRYGIDLDGELLGFRGWMIGKAWEAARRIRLPRIPGGKRSRKDRELQDLMDDAHAPADLDERDSRHEQALRELSRRIVNEALSCEIEQHMENAREDTYGGKEGEA